MVAVEFLADGVHAHAGHFPDDVHGHLAGGAHIGAALFAADIGGQHVVGAGHLVDDFFNGHRNGLGIVQGVFDGGGGHADAGGDALQHIIGVELFYRALKLADVLLEVVGDVFRHIVGQVQVEQLGLALDDGHPRFKIRRLDIGGQAPLKPGAQAFLQTFDLLGGPVRRDHDLFAGVVQRVEGVEKLLLRALFAGQELDIVDQQHIGQAVFLAELLGGGGLDGLHDLVGELFTVHIHDVEIGVVFLDLDADGVEQVGLAQAGRTVDEQRIVRAGRVGRHGLSRRKGKLVGRALDEIFKGESVLPGRNGQFFVQSAFGRRRGFRLRHNEPDLHIKAQNLLEGVLHQAGVAVLDNAADKVVADLQRNGVGVFKADGFQRADVVLIGCLGGMFAAVSLGRVQYVVE